MRALSHVLFSAALAVVASAPADAQQPALTKAPQVEEAAPGLLRRAKITPEAATRTALARVPNGRVQSAEIEEEHGRLVYSYDLKVPGKSGVDEVLIDAATGSVVSQTHESPAQERAEARKDAHEARKDAQAARKAPGGKGAPR